MIEYYHVPHPIERHLNYACDRQNIMKASPRAAAREPHSVAARTRSSIDLSGARDWRERIMADEDYLVLTETQRKPSERPRVSRSPTPHERLTVTRVWR